MDKCLELWRSVEKCQVSQNLCTLVLRGGVDKCREVSRNVGIVMKCREVYQNLCTLVLKGSVNKFLEVSKSVKCQEVKRSVKKYLKTYVL